MYSEMSLLIHLLVDICIYISPRVNPRPWFGLIYQRGGDRWAGERCPAGIYSPLWVNSLCSGTWASFDEEFCRFEYRKLASRITWAHRAPFNNAVTGPGPTRWIEIHVFLGRSKVKMNKIFRTLNPVLDRTKFRFKVTVFIKPANNE